MRWTIVIIGNEDEHKLAIVLTLYLSYYKAKKFRWWAYTLACLRSFLAFKQKCRPTARPTLVHLAQALVQIVIVLAVLLYSTILPANSSSLRQNPLVCPSG